MEITGLGSLKASFSSLPFGREWSVSAEKGVCVFGGKEGVILQLFSIKYPPSKDVLVETVLEKLYLG